MPGLQLDGALAYKVVTACPVSSVRAGLRVDRLPADSPEPRHTMSYQPFRAGGENASRRFCLYAAGGRIYAQDVRSVLIDIGEYERAGSGFVYRIAGDTSLAGEGFAGADDVLRDLAGCIDASFLDTRFGTLPDRSEDYTLDLSRAAHRDLQLVAAPEADEDTIDIRGVGMPATVSGRARQPSLAGR